MPSQRKTPEDDVNRLAERVWLRGRGKIETVEDFNAVYDSYMTSQGQTLTSEQRGKLKKEVYQRVVNKHHLKIKHGKNDKREVLFKRAGTSPSPAEFTFLAKSGRRKVYARRTHYTTKKGQYVVAYRDVKGRFCTPLSEHEAMKYEQKLATKKPLPGQESTASVSSKPVTYDPSTGKYV